MLKGITHILLFCKPAWHEFGENEITSYKINLENRLKNINIPQSVIHCTTVHRRNTSHAKDFALAAGNKAFPNTKPVINIPDWNSEVRQLKDDAIF